MTETEKYLDSVGRKGSDERLRAIASTDLGERSEAAKRVNDKRYRRLELIRNGFDAETAKLIVAREK